MPSRIRLSRDRSIPAVLRRKYLSVARRWARAEAAARKAASRKRQSIAAAYQRDLRSLLGREADRRYRALRAELVDASRARRLRASNSLLNDIQFDRVRWGQLRSEYFASVSALIGLEDVAISDGVIGPVDDSSPWVEHRAPYAGEIDTAQFETRGDVGAPVFTRQINRMAGLIRSGIRIGVSGAGNNDEMEALHHAAFTIPHTALANGPLEGFAVFEFRRPITYSGEVRDEFGISTALHGHGASARIRVVSGQAADVVDSFMFGETDFEHGSRFSWNRELHSARDLHWYYFRTNQSWMQGTTLIIEAGVVNGSWFRVDDMSIDMQDDLDVRLDKVMVRSTR